MYINSVDLDGLLKAHEESDSESIKEKEYRDGIRDARKLLKQIENAGTSESEWLDGTCELFCQHCGKGVRKPRKGDVYEFCPHCGAKMRL